MKRFSPALLSLVLTGFFSGCESMRKLTDEGGSSPAQAAHEGHDHGSEPEPTPAPTPPPSASIYEIYSDQVPYNDPRFKLVAGGTNGTINEVIEGVCKAPEGARYAAIAPDFHFGFTVSVPPTDLSAFYGGTVRFFLRLKRPLTAGEDLLLSIAHYDGGEPYPPFSSQHGFNPSSTEWQEISVPLNFYTQDQFKRIVMPFGLVTFGAQSALGYDIDAVRWTK